MVKTTKKDFRLFKKHFMNWFKRFSLGRYEARIFWADIDSIAITFTSESGKIISVSFAKELQDVDYTKKMIKFAARHEVLDIVSARLGECARARYVNEEEITESIHDITRSIEFMLDNYKK